MIFEAVFGILFGFVSTVLGLFPDYTSSVQEFFEPLSFLVGGIRFMANWINLAAMFGVLGLWATIEVGASVARAVQWLYGKVPLKST